MNAKSLARFEARAKIIKAMAHPTRLFIVTELAGRERCVCELTGLIGADISTVSKHLSILKSAGIVEDEKRGAQVYYRLHCPCILQFCCCADEVVKTVAKEQLELSK
ncbi:MAG: winged helix-turn-helix transcriptional regulator [Candidatus Hydrogenedentes bacterium]|nr:winged helix-turn-helix transcriptional regulator [Candidatus Hydrogenedentota bacterium]